MARVRQVPNPTDLDLRLLRVFETVVRAGSFTAAEVELNKSKSSISMDISTLERRLGLKLCRRGRSGFALTSQGKKIHAITLDLFNHLQEFRGRVGQVASRIEGVLAAAMDDNFPVVARTELSEAIRMFSITNPAVFLSVRASSPEHVVQLVLEGSADLGMTAVPRHIPELLIEPMFEETMVLFCGNKHPLFDIAESQIGLATIAKYPCVDVVARQSPRAAMMMDGMHIQARACTVSSRLLFVLSGNFLGFLPQEFVSDLVTRGELRPLLVEEVSYQNTCYAVVRRDTPQNAARDCFLGELKRVFAPQRDILATRAPNRRPSTVGAGSPTKLAGATEQFTPRTTLRS